MPELPAVSGKKAVAAFRQAGFEVARIAGAHHIMKKPGHRARLSVPVHGNKTLKRGTLRSLIRASELTIEEFAKLV